MTIKVVAINLLNQLSDALEQLDRRTFQFPVEILGNSTIGQHVRHTLEFFICLQSGLKNQTVNYDSRARDLRIEEDLDFCQAVIEDLKSFIDAAENTPLTLAGEYLNENDPLSFSLSSCFERELAYNIEHTVHHMAMIRVAFRSAFPQVKVADNFGVASSTVAHQKSE
ncbi:DinB family protein [Persicobacter psychrovividus]|uniref:DinB family protein n=1 Tax=Persicobacter psychrovividus TaxID=387638 RepID=A0ABM7VHE3_9BACT|nr:hypothetical protein PEPS_26780 [Persicobacter psychrovividus]